MRRIIVLGTGLAGVRAATILERRLQGRRHTELVVVSESSHFVYRPLLPHVVSGALETASISVPLNDLFDASTDVRIERFDGIDPDRRIIHGPDGNSPSIT